MFDEIALTERQGREFQILFVCREFENEFLNEIKVGVFWSTGFDDQEIFYAQNGRYCSYKTSSSFSKFDEIGRVVTDAYGNLRPFVRCQVY